MKKSKFLLITLIIVLSACAPKPSETVENPASVEKPAETYMQETQTAVTGGDDVPSITEELPTAEPRLAPEDWRDWPVIPEVTDTAREIYSKGIAMGNDPHAFSKVGDCQNVHQSFLGFFDHPGQYEEMSGITKSQDTIDNFSGYFDRDGQATQYGFNAAAVLSPLWADSEVCLPDENPLECELRITQPTFVLISLEFWFAGRNSDVYELYMRQIIEYTISQDAVPILATKADNVEEDHSINLVTAQLAYEYDIPLWNWWAAAQPLGDHGIDPYRDGFHISVEAWNVRSKIFLQTLDNLWEGMQDIP